MTTTITLIYNKENESKYTKYWKLLTISWNSVDVVVFFPLARWILNGCVVAYNFCFVLLRHLTGGFGVFVHTTNNIN